MPQPVAVPGVSPSQFVRQVAGIQFDTNQALCAVKGVPLSKEDQKKACVLCRKAGKQWHESLSCPGRHRNHKRACPLRHHAGGKPAPSASTVNIATQYGEQSTASPSQKRSREEATQGNSTSECSTVRVYFEWYPRSSARMDYMVDAILGKTSMGECVQAFELAAGVHVGQEVHAMVNNVHVFADMPHLLHHSTEWLDMVEEKNDLTQHFVLHVSVFPRMYNTSSDNNRNDVSTSSSSDTIMSLLAKCSCPSPAHPSTRPRTSRTRRRAGRPSPTPRRTAAARRPTRRVCCRTAGRAARRASCPPSPTPSP